MLCGSLKWVSSQLASLLLAPTCTLSELPSLVRACCTCCLRRSTPAKGKKNCHPAFYAHIHFFLLAASKLCHSLTVSNPTHCLFDKVRFIIFLIYFIYIFDFSDIQSYIFDFLSWITVIFSRYACYICWNILYCVGSNINVSCCIIHRAVNYFLYITYIRLKLYSWQSRTNRFSAFTVTRWKKVTQRRRW